MLGLLLSLVLSLIVSYVAVIPLAKHVMQYSKERAMFYVKVLGLVIFLNSFFVKSFFTVFLGILPILIFSVLVELYFLLSKTKKKGVRHRLQGYFWFGVLLIFTLSFTVFVFGKAWIGVPVTSLADAESVSAFGESVSPENIRTVPHVLAYAFAESKNAYSNFHVGGLDVFFDPVGSSLVWTSSLEPDNFLIGLSRPSPGYITGEAAGKIEGLESGFVEHELMYTESRPLHYNVYTRIWLEDPFHEYGDSTLVKAEDGNVYWIVPLKRNFFGVVVEWSGVAVVDAKTGKAEIYKANEVPEMFSGFKVYPKTMASWRVSTYSFFKHGVANALLFKRDIEEIPFDSEPYLVNFGDDAYWFVSVEPVGEEKRALSGYYMIKANGNDAGKATFVDKRGENLVGPVVASNYVQSAVSNYAYWNAVQALLYPYEGKETWFVPIIYDAEQLAGMKIVGVGKVDAASRDVAILSDLDGAEIGEPKVEDRTLLERFEAEKEKISESLEEMQSIIEELKSPTQ